MTSARTAHAHPAGWRIWGFALGYFAAYVPYALLAKSITSGQVGDVKLGGTSLLPIMTATSALGMFVFISAMGWWHHTAHTRVLGMWLPRPRLVTFLSGIATATIVLTTTLAYTFDGLSVLFAMLLMRGGVLVLGPIIDQVTSKTTGRGASSIPWWSWAGSGLALVALVIAFAEDGGVDLVPAAAIDIALYLTAYFFRLRWMTLHTKGPDNAKRENRLAFFVEEQMVATPLALVALAVFALASHSKFGLDLQYGFTALWAHPEVLALVALAGLCSQGTGIFGALIVLEPQENAYTVPVNRASSVLAGVVASLLMSQLFDTKLPSEYEFAGAGVIVAAIIVLSYPVLARRFGRGRSARNAVG